MRLTLEGHPHRDNPTVADVAWAARQITSLDGPTCLVVFLGDEEYAQAAGTRGRYVIESRTSLGEGFQHFRVWHPLTGPDGPTVVRYRLRCSRHRPRRCPLHVRESEARPFAEVEQALVHFVKTGKRDGRLLWRDVTAEYAYECEHRAEDDDEITQIVPGG